MVHASQAEIFGDVQIRDSFVSLFIVQYYIISYLHSNDKYFFLYNSHRREFILILYNK